MALENAELLDVVRRLRTYMATLDNCHMVCNIVKDIEDPITIDQATKLMPELIATAKKISQLLRTVETGRQYRELVKLYTKKEEDNG